MIPFSDLARAAFCPRQLYYARREDDRSPPEEATARIDLAFRYPDLVDADDRTLRDLPIRRSPAAYRRNLTRLRARLRERGPVDERGLWSRVIDPAASRIVLDGRECRGVVHKVLEPDGEPPIPVVVSPGDPPENGVWESQSVRAVAAAKALAWEREREVPWALVEYPAVGVARDVRLTTRRKAVYRRAVRAVRSLDGPPPRVADDRCASCDYRDRCGTRTRSLRSLLR